MFGSIDVKTRPIRLAYLIDPANEEHFRDAMQVSSTLWGGSYCPIIPLYKRMPRSWREGPLKAPAAQQVVLGYVNAFDPDILVQYATEVPSYVTDLGLRLIKPAEIWQSLDEEGYVSPSHGIGVLELLSTVFDEYFKYKSKFPVRVVIPNTPKDLSLFWTSLFGKMPSRIQSIVEKHYREALDIETIDVDTSALPNLMKTNVLFPRRVTQRGLRQVSRAGFRRRAYVYFCDATSHEDLIEYWNLRAIGRPVLPVPKQLKDDPHLREIAVSFLRGWRRPWRHDPQHADFASILRARSCTLDEVQEYAKKLNLEPEPNDRSKDPYFALQRWYPRVWDEWARDKDGAVPDDLYSEDESSTELADTKELRFRLKPLLPRFAERFQRHGEPRCANEVSFQFYGSEEYLAEVFPRSTGRHLVRAIAGITSFRDWRVGRNGLVKLVSNTFSDTREIPRAESVMFSWLTDLGWKPKLSPPGLLAKQIYARLEGHVQVLQNEQFMGLLEHMNGGSVKSTGEPREETKIGQERELSVGEVKKRLTMAAFQGPDLYDFALSKDIFRLGPRMQCPKCLRHSWYGLDDVRATFTCPKCQSKFSAVGNLDRSSWFYKTTGPFSVPGYADGAYAVLLTLEFFDDRKLTTLRSTPVVSFTAESTNKTPLEADLALLWEESVFGEKRNWNCLW